MDAVLQRHDDKGGIKNLLRDIRELRGEMTFSFKHEAREDREGPRRKIIKSWKRTEFPSLRPRENGDPFLTHGVTEFRRKIIKNPLLRFSV